MKEAIKLIEKSPHPNAAIGVIQRSKGHGRGRVRKRATRERLQNDRNTKLAKQVKDLQRQLALQKAKTIEMAKTQRAATSPIAKAVQTSPQRTKPGRAKQCAGSSRFAPKWMTDAKIGCSSEHRRNSKICRKQNRDLANVLTNQGKCGQDPAKCKTKSLAGNSRNKQRRWDRFQDFASSVLGKCIKRSDTRRKPSDGFIVFPGECLSAKGECKCIDGKYMASLGGPRTQQLFYSLSDKMGMMITMIQQYLCHDVTIGEGIDEANELGEGLWRRRRRRRRRSASIFKRLQKSASKAFTSVKKRVKKLGAKAWKGAKSAAANTAWKLIKKRVPIWAKSTLKKMVFEGKFSGKTLWKGMRSEEFFADYQKKNWKKYLTAALGMDKEQNKYTCMLLNSLGNGLFNGKRFSTRTSANLVRIGTSPPKPAKPDPSYDLPNEATSIEMWLTQGDVAFWNKARSSTYETMQDKKSPICMPPKYTKAKDASIPENDGTIWGCPTAIPKGSSGNWRWETSTGQQIPPPKCSMRLKFVMSACDTCCCKVCDHAPHLYLGTLHECDCAGWYDQV